jgi:predicted nucleic acid-binding protein
VNLVDANVLLYAVNEDSQHHQAARSWLDHALRGATTVAWSWPVLLAFLRIATRPGIFPRPLPGHRRDAWRHHLGGIRQLVQGTAVARREHRAAKAASANAGWKNR